MSTSPVSIQTFFKYYIYTPHSDHLTPQEKRIVSIVSTFFSILTLTLLPRFCRNTWSDRHVWNEAEKAVIFQRIKQLVHDTTRQQECNIIAKTKVPCDQILGGLFLGNSEAFIDTTHLVFSHPNAQGEKEQKVTTNYRGFQKVITLCPMSSVAGNFPGIDDIQTKVTNSFLAHKIGWLNVGKATTDNSAGWLPLVHDCTFPDSEEAQKGFDVKLGMEQADFEQLCTIKTEKIKKEDVKKWFEPVFSAMDEALLNENKKMLVHCQAGKSRSPTILAAYLINRLQLNVEVAISFLKKKRESIDSKFTNELQTYRTALTT